MPIFNLCGKWGEYAIDIEQSYLTKEEIKEMMLKSFIDKIRLEYAINRMTPKPEGTDKIYSPIGEVRIGSGKYSQIMTFREFEKFIGLLPADSL